MQNVQWPEETEQSAQFHNAIEQTVLAEEWGFDSAFFVEHHFTRHGILSSTLGLLNYLAGKTSRIRLGTAVLVLPFHDPVRLAEEASMVDVFSGGRLDLGVGRGFQWAEFNGFGQSLDDSTARSDEALDVILRGWREPGTFSHAGRFWTYNDVSVEPKPLQQPHPPIWVAAGSPASATKTGRMGLKMQLSSGVAMHKIPEMLQAYKDGLAESGFSYSPDQVLLSRLAHIEATRARAWEVAGPPYNWFRKMLAEVAPAPGNVRRNANPLPPQLTGAVGSDPNDPGIMFCTPDECAECIEQIDAMGVGQVIFQQNWGGMPQEDVVRSLRLLATEVMPSFSATRV